MSTPPHFHLLTPGVLVKRSVTHSGGPRTIPSDEVYRIASLGIKKLGGPESRSSSLLVILHYLLKNNITFMWGIAKEKSPPEGASGNRVTGTCLLTEGGGRIVNED